MITPVLFYDYDRQAWVEHGVYVDCGHRAIIKCRCYGRIHAGEAAPASASDYLRREAGR